MVHQPARWSGIKLIIFGDDVAVHFQDAIGDTDMMYDNPTLHLDNEGVFEHEEVAGDEGDDEGESSDDTDMESSADILAVNLAHHMDIIYAMDVHRRLAWRTGPLHPTPISRSMRTIGGIPEMTLLPGLASPTNPAQRRSQQRSDSELSDISMPDLISGSDVESV